MTQYAMAININDRHVREKLVNQGAATLSDAELLSVVLGKGAGELSAVETARKVLDSFGGNLSEIGRCPLPELRMRSNLGVSHAAMIAAVMELARRYKIVEGDQKETIRCDQDIIDIFQPMLAELDHEECWAIFLNTAGRIIDRIKVSQGGMKGTVIDYKLIVKRGVEKLAHAAVVVHNHPSGNASPSVEDNTLTERLFRVFSLFDIILLDHMIITKNDCYGFREHGFFDDLAGTQNIF